MMTVTLTGKIVAIMAIIAIISLGALFTKYRNFTNKIVAHQNREIRRLKEVCNDLTNAYRSAREEFEDRMIVADNTKELSIMLIRRNDDLRKENEQLKKELQAKKTEEMIY